MPRTAFVWRGKLVSYASQLAGLAVPLAENAKAAGFALTPEQLDRQVWREAVNSGDFDLTMQNNENFGINGDFAVACNIYFAPDADGATEGAGQDPAIKDACASLTEDRSTATVTKAIMAVQERNAEMAFVIPVTERVSSWVVNDAWQSAAPDAFYIPISPGRPRPADMVPSGTVRAVGDGLRAVAHRSLNLVLTMVGASLVTFALIPLSPGSPAVSILTNDGRRLTDAAIAAKEHELGLDRPLVAQYLSWISKLLPWGPRTIPGRRSTRCPP